MRLITGDKLLELKTFCDTIIVNIWAKLYSVNVLWPLVLGSGSTQKSLTPTGSAMLAATIGYFLL